ncbi:hypothetical protein L915_07546 [Phytophthora nicotianae]|uniref:Uncharacterized protein n=1 Tax=Phytophthora nicotianae TaxID=4792 RepID=W2JWC9_PHYNI|nr:hypothetical protein L915_07546 [Phytophthora nicotianae]ETL50646.1 hypothetical protein L916_00139 [Phytophthora nicotianae]
MTTKFTAAELKRFRAFLDAAIDREEHGSSSDDADALKRQFWGEIRVLLGVNGMSTGLPHLDQLVKDVLQGKANVGLQGPVVILPAAPGVPSAAPPVMTQPASPGVPSIASSDVPSTKSSGKKPAKSSKKSAKRKASTSDTVTKSPAKKPRAAQTLTLPFFDYAKLLEVNPKASRVVHTTIAIVPHKAEEAGKVPWRLAYPWSGRPLWYDPPENQDIHRAYWRFLMTHRRAFWEWAFYAPLETTSAQSNRRKLNMRASHARLSFTSLCIETWGFYVFLEKLEKRPEMFWLGGQPDKSPRGGRQPQGPIAEDLAVLHDKDPARYEVTLENALNPAKVYAFGCPQVLSFLEFTEALNPKAIAKSRPSMTALARIRQDLTSGTKLKTSWIINPNADPWKALTSYSGVKQRRLEVMTQIADRAYELPSVDPPSQRERDRDDWSDFEDADNDDDQAVSSSAGAGTPAQGTTRTPTRGTKTVKTKSSRP